MREKMKERFLNYITYDTKSDPESSTCPSSKGQVVLGKRLVEELNQLGLKDAYQDENGYVYASIEGENKKAPVIGLIAHMDTAPDLDGKVDKPQILTYTGGDIVLNDKYSLKAEDYPFLENMIGEEIITTDGNSLLGGDNKAGITIIMSIADYLMSKSDKNFGSVKIAFTPDEEIGRGADLFDLERFGADFAYTLDGGPEGELQYESFNAASAFITIAGNNVHPGTAKDLMVNSISIGQELDSLLPANERPEYRDGYEGFYLLNSFEASVDSTTMSYIIRDFDRKEFERKKKIMEKAVEFLNLKYGERIQLKIEDSYYNMKEKIKDHMEIVELAKKSMEEIGVEALIQPVRGGTDGSRLSFMGLPTPNIFVGGYNYHGRYEILSVDQMEKAYKTVVRIIENNSKKYS